MLDKSGRAATASDCSELFPENVCRAIASELTHKQIEAAVQPAVTAADLYLPHLGLTGPELKDKSNPVTGSESSSLRDLMEVTAGGALAVGIPSAALGAGRAVVERGVETVLGHVMGTLFPHMKPIEIETPAVSEAALSGLMRGGAVGAAAFSLGYLGYRMYREIADHPGEDPWSQLQQ